MFIEQIERLRCTSPHEETWLIATFIEVADRFINKGKLGCYLCNREFLIEEGIAVFKAENADEDSSAATLTGNTSSLSAIATNGAIGAAAFLNPSERSTLVLMGDWCSLANAITEIIQVKIFALNPSVFDSSSGSSSKSLLPLHETEDVSIVMSYPGQGIPLARGTVSGVALDERNANRTNIDASLRVLMPGGRLVAPVSIPLPPNVTELARDDYFWVAEKARELVMLSR